MVNNIMTKMKALALFDLPKNLHQEIMAKVYWQKNKKWFFLSIFIVALNLLFSAWRIWQRLLEYEGISVLAILLNSVDFTFAYLFNFYEILIDIIPLELVGVLLINILLAAVLFKYIRKNLNNNMFNISY